MKCIHTFNDQSILKKCWGVLECSWEMREIVEHFRDYENVKFFQMSSESYGEFKKLLENNIKFRNVFKDPCILENAWKLWKVNVKCERLPTFSENPEGVAIS